MATVTQGNKVFRYYCSRSVFDTLTKSDDGLYFVYEEDGRLSLYKGGVLVAPSFKVVTSLPSAGEQGRLYYDISSSIFYFYNGSAWRQAFMPIVDSVSGVNASSTDAQIPTAKAVYNAIAEAGVGGTSYTLAPVQDVAELKTKGASDAVIADKSLILVEDLGALFRFDSESTEPANDSTVIAPAYVGTGAGRWIAISSSSIQFDSSDFTWGDAGLKLNDIAMSKVTGLEAALGTKAQASELTALKTTVDANTAALTWQIYS